MKVAGIIAECNPLHEGHKYLIRQARQKTDADYVIIALSGDYVQRGAPAILSREERTRALLAEGADLVIELPLYVSCAGADYFARGGVALLESLGVVTDLVFGSETGDLMALQEAALRLSAEDAYSALLREGLKRGLSFPQARAVAAGRDLPSSPNDLLGAEYLKALHLSGSAMRPHAIPRTACRSASAIRSQLLEERQSGDPFLCRDDFSELLLHALIGADSEEALCRYLDVSGGLAGRILHALPSFTTFSAFCEAVKTRNYTYTRVSRALMHILLGMTAESMEQFDRAYGLCGWIRPIGFKHSAGPLLRAITSACSVPFLYKLSEAESLLPAELHALLRDEIRAEFLYDLMATRRTGAAALAADAAASHGAIPQTGKSAGRSLTGVPNAFQKPLIIVPPAPL